MAKYVLPTILVCLVISNYVNWGVNGIERAEPDSNSFEIRMKEKCEKNSPNNRDAYKNYVEATKKFQECSVAESPILPSTELKNKMDVAKAKGEIDIVSKELCKKSLEYYDCGKNFTFISDVCKDASEKNKTHFVRVVLETVLSFVCNDEGARLALFYSEGGLDCLMNKKEALEQCFINWSSKYNNSSFVDEDDASKCKRTFELQPCVLDVLKTCNKSTANMIKSLFDLVHSSPPCSQFKNAEISLN